MARSPRSTISAPRWDKDRLERDRTKAIEAFRDERMKEPLEKYLEVFEEYRDAFDELMETTVDLRDLSAKAMDILTNQALCEALRYLPGPPISLADIILGLWDRRVMPIECIAIAPSDVLHLRLADPSE